MSKQTVIVSGGALEEEFTLNILNSEDTEFVLGVDRGLGSSQQRPGARAGEPVGTCSLAGPRRGIGGAAEPGQAQGDAAADRLRAVQYRAGG